MRLRGGPSREVRAAQPVREAEVVLDAARLARLAAGCLALDHDRLQPLRGVVDRGRQPGGPAADDHEVVVLGRRLAGDAEAVVELEDGGALEDAPVLEQRDGQAVVVDAGDLQQLTRLGVALDVQPASGHEIAGEEVAQLVRGAREAMPDQPHPTRLQRRA